MQLFRRSQSLERVGQQHFKRCETLTAKGGQIGELLEKAMSSLPMKILREADADQEKAACLVSSITFLSGWLLRAGGTYADFLFAYSLFSAAQKAQLNCHLYAYAGRAAAQQMTMIMLQDLERRKFNLLGSTHLEKLGYALSDYSIIVTANVLSAMQVKVEGKTNGIHYEIAKDKALKLLPFAREQHAKDKSMLDLLDTYEHALRL